MKNIGKIIQFEYLNCVRNKAFIIITAAILLLIIASSFLPGVIMSLASPETEKTDNQEIAVICSDSLYGGELVSREFCRCFPETAVVLSKEDIETVKSKVNDSKYRFAAEITGALEYTYITKNNSIYDTNMQNCAQAIKAMYVSTFLEPYGIKADQADALVYADVQNRVLTTGTDQTVDQRHQQRRKREKHPSHGAADNLRPSDRTYVRQGDWFGTCRIHAACTDTYGIRRIVEACIVFGNTYGDLQADKHRTRLCDSGCTVFHSRIFHVRLPDRRSCLVCIQIRGSFQPHLPCYDAYGDSIHGTYLHVRQRKLRQSGYCYHVLSAAELTDGYVYTGYSDGY